MKNPNQDTSEEVLRRLKEASYERMRVELKNSVELKMKDFDMTWDDIGYALRMQACAWIGAPTKAERAKRKIIEGSLTLNELNAIAHVFSCEPYIIFRPREPWVAT